ncbi:MAG TPA: tetraacyldisaccharide 4'-kinase [Hyphomicrobiales bacterium]|nr:tetraacyldisaccharide 4'-kinase [Hyphomicrobiales bacterium]
MLERLKTGLPRAWYSGAPWLALLLPLSWLYGWLAARRRRRLAEIAYRATVPVVVVGNLTVGGTGKTPLTAALARYLQEQGRRVVIVSRGYGGQSASYPLEVDSATPVEDCGDEALLLALQVACPVVVDPVRSRAVLYAETRHLPDVILCDDGLQHYALARDVEIAVVDGSRGFGNGRLLPAGPLREGLERLAEVDCLVVNGTATAPLPPSPVPSFTMQLKTIALRALASGQPVPLAVWCRQHGKGPFHAVAGTGNPQRFFASLRALGFAIIEHAFADHQRYRPGQLDFADGLPVLMTDKDAVKYLPHAGGRHWSVQVEVELPAAFFGAIEARLPAPI